MSTRAPLTPWQILRPILSLLSLLLLPLLWGDEGCGKGPRTGFELFGHYSVYWIVPAVLLIAAGPIITRRLRPEMSLIFHLIAFLSSAYLAFAAGVLSLLLNRKNWPGPVFAIIFVAIFFDSSREMVVSVGKLGRNLSSDEPATKNTTTTTSPTEAQPFTRRAQLGLAFIPIAILILISIPPYFTRAPSKPARSDEPKDIAVKLGPLRPLPFTNRAAFTETTERHAPILGQLPMVTETPMWTGTVYHSPHGFGFGRHEMRATYLLQGGQWLLVHAHSGLWLLETATLERRARLNTGDVPVVDVTRNGDRVAYADCAADGLSADRKCDLVVLRTDDLSQLHRSEILYPAQLRFSPNANLIAVSRGHFGGATVISVDSGKALFSTHVLSSVVAAIPISETRVAYVSGSGQLAIEEANRKDALYLGRSDDPVMTFPFKMGIARSSAELVYDPASDRVLELGSKGARVLEGVSTATPHLGQPLSREELQASKLRDGARNYSADDLDARFKVKQFDRKWNVDGIWGYIGAKDEVVGIVRNRIARATADGVMRSVDFGEAESSWSSSYGKDDLVLWHSNDHRVTVRRAELRTPALDYTPEIVGEFDSGYSPQLLQFPSGDNAFIAFDDNHHATLVRLPRGEKVAAAEPISVEGLHNTRSSVVGEGRFAFMVESGQVLEINDKTTQILTTDAHWPEKLDYDEKSHCFALKDHNVRFIGSGCAPSVPSSAKTNRKGPAPR